MFFQLHICTENILNMFKFYGVFLFVYFKVARHFYHKDMHIELVREELLFDTIHVTFQLTFDNRAFTLASLAMTREEKHLPISASVLFEIFPFCIVFGYCYVKLYNFIFVSKSRARIVRLALCKDWMIISNIELVMVTRYIVEIA